MYSTAQSDALHSRVRTFISACSTATPPGEDVFRALALDIARYQVEHVPPVARLSRARGLDLGTVRDPKEIPALPCDVFRLARVAAHPPELDAAIFRTSGTSQGREARGEHAFRTTETYALAALSWAERFLWPDRPELDLVVLAPDPLQQPDSSLGFMIGEFARRLGGRTTYHVVYDERGSASLDLVGVAERAAEARASNKPVLVIATSFALVHLLDALMNNDAVNLSLPDKSRLMHTGGFKGRTRQVAPNELRARASKLFSVPEARVVGEYGMTELSSQLYEATLSRSVGAEEPSGPHGWFFSPPWVRVVPVDPVTLEPVGPGGVGIAKFIDLANIDSSIGIQTSDRIRLSCGAVELLGREPGAPPRGCSITIDEILEHL